ncbi:MAG: hypothetical protein ACREC0_00215 [Methylocella sp.]
MALAALTVLTNHIANALDGLLIRQMLNRFRIDPAVSSGTFMTVVADVGKLSALSKSTAAQKARSLRRLLNSQKQRTTVVK